MSNFFLLESGDTLLLESGDALALESYVAAVTSDTNPLTVTIREGNAIAVREARRMSPRVTYNRNAEKPSMALWWTDNAGDLIDFSSGYSFSFKVGERGQTALLTKTTNITGAAGAGVAPTGTPNVVIDWAAGDLDLTPGTYLWQLKATSSSADRYVEGTFVILDAID